MPETADAMRLLLIEDSEDDAELVVRAIRRQGIDVTPLRVASEQALRGALVSPWDLVISDFKMPAFDGWRAFEIVKQMQEAVPFIFVSGEISEDDAIAAMRAGARDYVFKSRLERLGPVLARELVSLQTRLQRDNAQRQLVRSSEAHQAMLETLPLPLVALELDRSAGLDAATLATRSRVVFGNREARKLLWHANLPLRGPASTVLGGESSPFFDWLALALTDGARANGREVHIKANTGRELAVIARAESRGDAQASLLVSLTDISSRVELERALRDKEATLNILKDTALDGYWALDLQAGTLEVSARWLRALGVADDSPRVSVPQWVDMVHPEDRERWLGAIDALLQRKKPLHLFMRFVTRSGDVRHVLCQGVAHPVAAERFTRIVGSCTDVTELEEARASAKQAEQAKSSFLNSMSHEIRTPLNAVLGLSQVLDGTTLDEAQRSHVDVIAKSGRRLLALINDVLDISRIDSGGLDVNHDAFDVQAAVRDVVQILAPDATEKGVAVRFGTRLPQRARFVGDCDRIRQVTFNLLSNAIKFTPEGFVRVALEVAPSDEGCLQITVEDTGLGMSEEQQARAFRPFEQGHVAEVRKFGGSGLGLTISRRIAEVMGGRVEVESSVGEGTAFRFIVPGLQIEARPVSPLQVCLLADESDAAKDVRDSLEAVARVIEVHEFPAAPVEGASACVVIHHSREVVSAAARQWPTIPFVRVGETMDESSHPHFEELRRYPTTDELAARLEALLGKPSTCEADAAPQAVRVLVAEDNPVNQRVVSLLLSKLNVATSFASNGREAIDVATREDYDLILMDCQMPEVDGWEATSTLRAMGITTPIVALTANVTSDARKRCEDVGMNAFLTKPVALKDLRGVIAQWARADVAATG